MMLRPRWVLALLAALGIAAAFAILAQWQIGRAVDEATVIERPTESVRPLSEIAQPDGPTEQDATGQRISVRGTIVPGDTVLVQGRLNHGVTGWWVVAHLEVTDAAPGGLPVALGWVADEESARDALLPQASERFQKWLASGLADFRLPKPLVHLPFESLPEDKKLENLADPSKPGQSRLKTRILEGHNGQALFFKGAFVSAIYLFR